MISLLIALLIIVNSCCLAHVEKQEPIIFWGVSERQGRRLSMEDTYIARTNQKNYDLSRAGQQRLPFTYCLFGIFDGHGGSAAAQLAATYFEKNFSLPLRLPTSSKKYFETIFEQTNKSILPSTTSGTTAVIAYIAHDEKIQDTLYIAWTGDSRAVLGRPNNTLLYETKDHKPDDSEERKLIEAKPGCFVTPKTKPSPARVNGVLGISRALGDRDLNKCISAEPAIVSVPLDPRHHRLLILACDGIWDVLTSQQALTLVGKYLEEQKAILHTVAERAIANETTTERGHTILALAARALIDAAYERGSHDNLSALVILFDWNNSFVAHKNRVIPKNLIDRLSEQWMQFWHQIRGTLGV